MPDIAFIGDRIFLFEKLIQDIGLECHFIQHDILGSPFLPKFKIIIIPTGFANLQYSKTLPALKRCKSNISRFIEEGGVLTVFGPLVPEHNYDWLPLPLRYIQDYRTSDLEVSSEHECSRLIKSQSADCDGYLVPSEDFDTVLIDSAKSPVLVVGHFGEGLIVATTIHEFPSEEYIRWAGENRKLLKI